MRSYIDSEGKVAWLFNEPQEVKAEIVVDKFDLNKDGVVDGKDAAELGRKLKDLKKKK